MSGARQGRRRRILQDEVLSASREASAYSSDEQAKTEGNEGRRYAFAEGSLGGVLAKRHFPSHWLAPVGVLIATTVAVAGLATLHEMRNTIGATIGTASSALLDATAPTSLATWLAAASMLSVAFMATMVLAVRRRRVDDYHGRHRLWRSAIVVATFLSIDAVTNLHSIAAESVASATGIRLMAGGSEWWLALGTLVFGWVGVRVLLDIKESKLALTAFVAAVVAGGVAVIGPIAGLGGEAVMLVAKLAQLTSYLLAGLSLVSYMRFLRQDVAAGVATKPQKSRPAELKLAKQTTSEPTKQATTDHQEDRKPNRSQTRRKAKQAKAVEKQEASEDRWTDGSDGYADSYDEGASPRKLSKAERKRMRQQKAGRRAA